MEKPQNYNKVVNEKKAETAIKVNVYIPENVRNRQEKINQIYNILKPKTA